MGIYIRLWQHDTQQNDTSQNDWVKRCPRYNINIISVRVAVGT
jgi:hypothetical protein